MEIKDHWMAILAIVLGLVILVFPDVLEWLVGIALIVGGIVAILDKKDLI